MASFLGERESSIAMNETLRGRNYDAGSIEEKTFRRLRGGARRTKKNHIRPCARLWLGEQGLF